MTMNRFAMSIAGGLLLAAPLFAQTAEDALSAYDAGNYAEALEIARPLSNAGDPAAQNLMGILYDTGLSVEPDPLRAIAYYEAAAEQGEASAMTNLADLYSEGWPGQEPQPELAIPLLLAAEAQGFTGALVSLGNAYYSGYFGAPDMERAVAYYRRSHEAGHVEGTENLAWMYEHGVGVAQDYTEARRLLVQAYEDHGSVYAASALGDLMRQGLGGPQDMPGAIRYFEAAAEQGDAYGANWLGYYYDQGEGGLEVDYARAVAYFRIAAEQGDSTGYFNLGLMYDNGRGVEQDLDQAAHYYGLAIEAGDGDAAYELAIMYWSGRIGYEDHVEARRLLELAMDRGNELAPTDLGRMLRNGVGGSRDIERAAQLFRLGTEATDSMAYVNLGEILSDPAYSEHDPVLGLAYCLRAIEITTDEETDRQYSNRCQRLSRSLSPEDRATARGLMDGL